MGTAVQAPALAVAVDWMPWMRQSMNRSDRVICAPHWLRTTAAADDDGVVAVDAAGPETATSSCRNRRAESERLPGC